MGKVDQSEAIRKMQQVLDSKACGVISAKKLGTARSCYSARDSGVSDHLATQNPLILDNSENEHGPLYKSEGSSVPELGFRYQETCRAAKGACATSGKMKQGITLRCISSSCVITVCCHWCLGMMRLRWGKEGASLPQISARPSATPESLESSTSTSPLPQTSY
jgi:hypothetical protein